LLQLNVSETSNCNNFAGGEVVIGIGIDAVEVERFREVLARTPGVARRLFTEAERAYGDRRRDPAERLAARFAAKEAVMKALGVGLGAFAFHDVEVVRAPSGQPGLELRGRAADLARERGVTGWRLSLTHTHRMAEAVAVAL
jgi:holo-[acyl-carrier protein] synthase